MILSALVSVMLQSGPGAAVEAPVRTQVVAKRRKKRRKRRKKLRKRKKTKPTAEQKDEPQVTAPATEVPAAKPVAASPEPVVEEQEQNLPGVAALDLQAVKGVDDSVAQLLNDAILTRLRASGAFSTVVGSADIAAMLTLEQQKQTLGCEDDSCLAQLGGALGVPYLFQATMGSVGGRLMLNIKILNVEEAGVAYRGSQVFADEGALLDGLNKAIDGAVDGVFGPVEAEAATQPADGPKPAPVVAPAQASTQPGSGLNWPAVGMGIVGAAAAGYGFVHAEGARNTFSQREDLDSLRALESDVAAANVFVGVGYGLVAGALLWGLL